MSVSPTDPVIGSLTLSFFFFFKCVIRILLLIIFHLAASTNFLEITVCIKIRTAFPAGSDCGSYVSVFLAGSDCGSYVGVSPAGSDCGSYVGVFPAGSDCGSYVCVFPAGSDCGSYVGVLYESHYTVHCCRHLHAPFVVPADAFSSEWCNRFLI